MLAVQVGEDVGDDGGAEPIDCVDTVCVGFSDQRWLGFAYCLHYRVERSGGEWRVNHAEPRLIRGRCVLRRL